MAPVASASLSPVPLSTSETPSRLFHSVVALVRRLYDTEENHLAVVGVFILMTYVYDVFDAVPYLQVVGDPATGKTRLGETLELLAFRAQLVARMSVAAMYRFLQVRRGVLIVDEQGVAKKELRDVMNAGYRRTGSVMYVGRGGELQTVSCFAPKVIITAAPEADEALRSRMITLVSQAARRPVERLALTKLGPELDRLRMLLSAFAEDHTGDVAAEYDRLGIVQGLTHRDFDLAAPLLSVAAVVDSSGDEPIRPMIEAFLADHAAARKRRKVADSQTSVLARLVLEYVSVHEPDDHRSGAAGPAPLYLAASLLKYINSVKVLDRVLPSAKVLGELLGARGLVVDRHVIDVLPHDHVRIAGSPRPRVQRTAYELDLERAGVLAEADTGR